MEAFRRPEIAGKKVAVIEHDSLQHDGRIDHPDLQRVIAGRGNRKRDSDFPDPVADCLRPIAFSVVLERVDDRARAIVHRDREAQATAWNKIERRRKDGLQGEAAGVIEVDAVLQA